MELGRLCFFCGRLNTIHLAPPPSPPLLQQCVTTEEDLAAVLGHEISHVLLRHSAEQMASTAVMNFVFVFLALLGLPVNELTLLLGKEGGRQRLEKRLKRMPYKPFPPSLPPSLPP